MKSMKNLIFYFLMWNVYSVLQLSTKLETERNVLTLVQTTPPPPTLEIVPYIHTSFFGPHTIQPAHKHYSTSLHTTFLKPPSSHSYKIVTSITRKMKDRNFFYQIFS